MSELEMAMDSMPKTVDLAPRRESVVMHPSLYHNTQERDEWYAR
jgi:hypothetical protein